MYDVTAIVPRGQGTGFRLAGVRVVEVGSEKEAAEVLAGEMDNGHNGVILIDEDYGLQLPPRLQKRIDEGAVPLVVNIPIISEWEYVHDRDEAIGNLIQRAVGYRIKFSGESK